MAQGTTRGVPIDIDPLLTNDSDLLVPSQKAIKTYVDTNTSNVASTKVSRSGDTMSGSLILSGEPTIPFGAATKSYVDTLINGIDWKAAANAGTTTALPTYTVSGAGQILTGTVTLGLIDGVTLTANQRLLVKNETSTKTPNNGIYVVTQVNPFILTRSSDANTSALLAEATISVSAGDTLSNTQWHCNPVTTPIVIGTTYITFAKIGSGTYSFSPPLVDTGSVISIPSATNSVNGYLSSTDWTNFNTAYTSRIATFSVTGDNGAATFSGNTLNIPTYTLVGLGGAGLASANNFANFNTFTNDILVNGITIGKGPGNISSNTAIGNSALNVNTDGTFNTAIGPYSLQSNISGSANIAIGFESLKSNTSNTNIGIGVETLKSNTIGSNNIAIGHQSSIANITGSNNISLGYYSGHFIANKSTLATILNNSIMLGYDTSPLADNQTNQIVIGYGTTGLGSNTTVLGNSSTVKTGIFGRTLIGTTLPTDDGTSTLQVGGYTSATGYKVPSATGFLKANGDVDPTTYAPIASPTFTGTPSLTTTPTAGDNTTKLASTAFVKTAVDAGVISNINIGTGTGTISFTTEATGSTGGISYPQYGKNVMVNNGASAITITVTTTTTTDFIASYTKLGVGSINFVAGAGTTLTGFPILAPNSTINGVAGSTALLTRTGNTFYVQINNLS